MMRLRWLFFIVILFSFEVKAQRDSIFISLKLDEKTSEIKVKQRIIYHNKANQPLSEIKLLNWASAYRNKGTVLAQRKLEDRRRNLFFSKKYQQAWVDDLEIKYNDLIINPNSNEENIRIALEKPLEKGESQELNLSYSLHLPNADFTGYGVKNGDFRLKYFFIVPDSFDVDNQQDRFFLDVEETQNIGSFWKVDLDLPNGYFAQSNFEGENSHFQGIAHTDFELYLSSRNYQKLSVKVDDEPINVELAYSISDKELMNLEFYLPLHLKFIKDTWGWLPRKILITPKQKEKMAFVGSQDFRLGNRRLSLFNDAEKTDLDYLNLLINSVVEQSFSGDKIKEHWLKNGLKTYMEIQYLKRFYSNHSLLGNSTEWRFLGLKPIKWLNNVSKLKLTDRYAVAYLLMMNDNLDQAIGTDYDKLRNNNQVAMSHFEMGTLLNFISEKEGKDNFEKFLKTFVQNHRGQNVDSQQFLEGLIDKFGDQYTFLNDFIQRKQRVDFSIRSLTKLEENQYQLKIHKNTLQNIPLQFKVENKEGDTQFFWLETEKDKKETTYNLAIKNPKKITINPNYIFPEYDFRNNFSEKKWLGFSKKWKLKLFLDIPNPEYNEVYLRPDFRFNVYDNFLMGLNFRNYSLISQPFSYSITPYFSIGEWKLMGSAGLSYKIQPVDSFVRRLTLGASGAYFNYDYNLSYRKFSLFSHLDFAQEPRSFWHKSLNLSYQYIDRELPQNVNLTRVYKHYGLANLGFRLSHNYPIHDKYVSANLQVMKDFQKLSLEGIYDWEYAHRKEARFRFFGGVFLHNNAKNRMFDFGVSRVNDYNFAYHFLGQSALTGFLAQEYILAEGGFKSYVGGYANQWLTAVNVDFPLWKMFSLYADAGFYKNKGREANFVWDSGVKVSIIRNVLELYFPLQSSLGFEPSLHKYDKRIRYSLNLNVNTIVRTLGRNRK